MAKRKQAEPELDAPTLAALHVSALTDGKKKYKIADAALDALLKQAKVGEVITLPSTKDVDEDLRGKKFRVQDRFAKKNSIGVGLSARRYELEEVTSP